MKETARAAIRAALKATLEQLQSVRELPSEGRWEYHRQENGSWLGRVVQHPSLIGLLAPARLPAASELQTALERDYPEYLKMVSTPLGGRPLQPTQLLSQLIYEAHERFGTFAITDDQIETLLADVSAFFDRDDVPCCLLAPALNLHGLMQTPPVTFPGGFILRPITDEEFTSLYGGNPFFGLRGPPIFHPNFVFAKESALPKLVGKFEATNGANIISQIQQELDRCLLALATFKDGGAVSYDGVRIAPIGFSPALAFSTHYGNNEYVPIGQYELILEDVPQLEAHARLLENLHPTLEMAAQRLIDSTRRTKPRDAIVDAVIGLEIILLYPEDRSELRFRFSLHYASLFPGKEREEAFHIARDLYDQRSKIAHGGAPSGTVRIGSKELSLLDGAAFARSVLRNTIATFVSNAKEPDFIKDGYWLSRALFLTPESQNMPQGGELSMQSV